MIIIFECKVCPLYSTKPAVPAKLPRRPQARHHARVPPRLLQRPPQGRAHPLDVPVRRQGVPRRQDRMGGVGGPQGR